MTTFELNVLVLLRISPYSTMSANDNAQLDQQGLEMPACAVISEMLTEFYSGHH